MIVTVVDGTGLPNGEGVGVGIDMEGVGELL
jgi:hypothetical protein